MTPSRDAAAVTAFFLKEEPGGIEKVIKAL